MACYRLPGIRAIGWIDSALLPPNLPYFDIAGMKVPVSSEISWLPISPGAKGARTTARRGSNALQSASLSFQSSVQIPPDVNAAVVVVDMTGAQWLIAANEPPFPVITEVLSTGLPSGEPAAFSYEVAHSAVRTMIPCSVILRR